MDNIDRELDWDSEINKESEFTLLPDGDYNFTVTSFERARHPGSAKLPPCNKAIIKIKIDGGELGSTTITHNLFLHTKCEGMHWWKFNDLIQGFDKYCILSRVREIRNYDLSEIHDTEQRAKMAEAQEQLKLPETFSKEEKEQINAFDALFGGD